MVHKRLAGVKAKYLEPTSVFELIPKPGLNMVQVTTLS